MNYLSDESRCYKNFISNNDILIVYNATPLEELQNMNIGSGLQKEEVADMI